MVWKLTITRLFLESVVSLELQETEDNGNCVAFNDSDHAEWVTIRLHWQQL